MKAAFARLLLRIVGRAYEVRRPEPLCRKIQHPIVSNQATVSADDRLSTKWYFASVGLKAGWYMLEIEHAQDSIGCVLTLLPTGSETSHLRLGSKKICKRIVWFSGKVNELAVSVDQPDCTLGRLSLIALSSSFAMSRVRQRLENRGSLASESTETAADVYKRYQVNLHDSIFKKTYRYLERDFGPVCIVDSVEATIRASVRLQLLQADVDDAVYCHSVERAVDFARKQGWTVDWQYDTKLVSEEAGGCHRLVYRMLVHNGVRYREDSIHQMLSAVDDTTVIVYADHDHVDDADQHFDPVLKPDWNPELLLNVNYVDLPWIISQSWFERAIADLPAGDSIEDALLLAAALGCGVETEVVALRMAQVPGQSTAVADGRMAALNNDQVKHIPEVLANRRMERSPCKQNIESEGFAWQRSVKLALERAGSRAIVSRGKLPGFTHVSWPLPAELPAVDIIVPTRDKVDILKKCLESVQLKTQYPNFRIVIVDNDSCEDETERYYQRLEADDRVTLLRYEKPFNYSAMNNYAVDCTSAPVVVLLNNDTEVISPSWLDELVRQALRPEIGCIGAKLHYSNGRIQHAGVVVGVTGVAGHAFRYERGDANGYCGRLQASQNYTAVTAACLAVRREVYLEAGGFDEENLSIAWNDVDFCMKVQASGLRNVWTPYVELFHHEGFSRGSDDTPEKVQRMNAERQVMIERWGLREFSDPAYHPLLTQDNENFGLGNAVT